ncbi:transcriptional regulator PpsR [Sphingomonas sp. M1-B02]|uniref:transcriptional regulator PpsR n=1 Tax=Sphingomonas sp. M1-B02 TaxID=3114300 RepID=UPI00223FA738|nr:transcriptional regulator PpsR [Sphingomonas sp. S6-11]UZK66652.1 transcriptional regulator PpsR [Sphingomonas sp. S6-11]
MSASTAASLLAAVGDLTIILTAEGVVLDVAIAQGELLGHGFDAWVGGRWIDTVTVESRTKVREMLDAASEPGGNQRWRQINHSVAGGDVPVRYLVMALGDSSRLIAIGRDMRGAAAMQQQLLRTQQSLERDYIRLRQVETRYRMLFDIASEPVLIVDAQTRLIREANPAAHRMLDLADGALAGTPVNAIVEADDRDNFIAHLGAAEVADYIAPVTLRLRDRRGPARISAQLFRESRVPLMLVRALPVDAASPGDRHQATLSEVVERMPDAFVLADRDFNILTANAAFVELTEMPSAERVTGAKLATWLGRPGIDLDLIRGQLREHGTVRNVATILRGSAGGQEEVEVSGVVAPTANGECYGFTIRNVARRMRDLPPAPRDVPRSVEQLTELVGRTSLKEIVRESTDLIERLCIEAALEYTSNNRASAAEILGVSRQSLYSKMHRHGLGNLVPDSN